ncbi:MAG: glpQ [Roseomonas sp.]|nr:glpQ [Roseomonas sp.]
MTTQIASHRGGAILWPENSPAAFRQTALLPVEQVEFDLHLSADDAVMVMHDALLDRTTEAHGPVRARSLAELRQVRLKGTGGEVVPTLAEVAEIFRPTGISLRIEIKRDAEGRPYPGLLPRMVTELEAAGMLERTIVTSFQASLAAQAEAGGRFRQRAIWLVSLPCWKDAGAAGIAAVARAHGIGAVGLHQTACDAAAVSAMRDAGLGVGAWSVNGEATLRRILALGVDVFTTDDPVAALALRSEGASGRQPASGGG